MTPTSASDSTGTRNWDEALSAARQRDVVRAREACRRFAAAPPPFPGGHEYLLGRCLAEAGSDLDEATALLEKAKSVDPKNVLTQSIFALTHLRAGREAEATALLEESGLPHDQALLTHLALEFELRLREPAATPPEGWPPWPPQLGPDPAVASPPLDRVQAPLAPRDHSGAAGDAASLIKLLERLYQEHDLVRLMREARAALGDGLDSADLHMIAGLAAVEGGDLLRGRAHLAMVLEHDPHQLLARTFLGRAYWRAGWFDLAEDLWRSLPVEGPDDYGRHYHLALAHETLGRRTEAFECMGIALRDFFVETREFHIQRVFERWMRQFAASKSPQSNGGEESS